MKEYIKSQVERLESWPCLLVSGVCLGISLYGWLAAVPAAELAAYGAVAISGLPLVYAALSRLCAGGRITSALLISIAMAACIGIGESFAAGEVAFIMALGEKLEDATVKKARKGLSKLVGLLPRTARRVTANSTEEVAAEAVQAGDLLRVLPGEIIPADGEVTEGVSAVNQAAITGESLPMEKKAGDAVFAGTINEEGCLDIRATRAAQETTLQQVIRLVQEADARKAPLQRTVDVWAAWLVPVALLLAVAAYLLTGSLERAVTVLVVFCPCALALATPTSVVAAIGQATRHGVLIKSGEALERMARVSCFALDKTGTLTCGKLTVSDIVSLAEGWDAARLLTVAAAVERRSEHPLAKAVCTHATQAGIAQTALPAVSDFRMVTGVGAEGTVEGHRVFCGRADTDAPETEAALLPLRQSGKAVLAVKQDERVVGLLALTDELRPTARDMVKRLRAQGCHLMLLTGDHALAARPMSEQAGIEEVHAALLPAEKLAVIAEREAAGTPVCMLGDGINDAPALKQAYIGIAMGGMGSEMARDAADITLMNDDLGCVPYIKRLAVATLHTIRFNLTLSLLINAVAITLSVLGLLGPVSGALVHNAGSVLVVLNAALLYERNFMHKGQRP